ncbi:hypothetical protein M770_33890 (plasmid) [Pseudomonas aeruginosa VRFPA03]|nr:hypothetical protein M770_33890 [Pseudomonas aeruginosa VRFPA03]
MRRASLHMLLCQFAMALGLLLSLGSEAWAARPAPQAAVDDARRQQFQLARRADDPAGLQQGTPGLLAEAGITVLADAHQGQPGRRRVCR